jgi:putative transposase
MILEVHQIDDSGIFNNSRNNVYKKLYFYGLKKYSVLTLKEIGKIFGIDYVAVSMQVKRFIEKSKKDSRIKMMIADFESKIKNPKC